MEATKEIKFAGVKVGDRVWANSGVTWLHGSDKLKTVVKTTPAFIVLDGSPEFNTFKRTGEAYGKFMVGRISRVASPQECIVWDAERERERVLAEAAEQAQNAAETKRAELRELFAPEGRTNTTYVNAATWGDERERAGKFDVTFHDLTEEQVRELAKKLS